MEHVPLNLCENSLASFCRVSADAFQTPSAQRPEMGVGGSTRGESSEGEVRVLWLLLSELGRFPGVLGKDEVTGCFYVSLAPAT